MKHSDYSNEVLAHCTENFHVPKRDLIHGIIGMTGEVGEIADLLKKQFFHPTKDVTRDQFIDELGDILWYFSLTARALGATLDEIMDKNTAKLKVRYKENGGNKNRAAELQAQLQFNSEDKPRDAC